MSRSDIIFTPTGPQAPSTSQVKAVMLANWQAAFDNGLNPDDRTPQGQLVTSETAIVQDKNNQLLYLINQFDPTVNEGVYQDAIGRIYFIDRHPARATVVMCRCTGLSGVFIPGTDADPALAPDGPALVQDDADHILACTASGTIPSTGFINLPFACQETGPIEIAAHTVKTIVRATPGWDSVDNESPGVVGQNVESRAAFEQRRYNSVAKNARSVLAAVYAEVGNLTGIIDLLCRQNRKPYPVTEGGVTLGEHSIYVCVLGGEDAAIAEAIYNSNSGGSDYNGNTSFIYTDPVTGAVETVLFQRPDELALMVQVTYRPGSTTPADIDNRIKAVVVADFYGEYVPPNETEPVDDRVRIGDTLDASRFYCLLGHAGIAGVISIKVAVASDSPVWLDSVSIPWDHYPALTAANVLVVQGG